MELKPLSPPDPPSYADSQREILRESSDERVVSESDFNEMGKKKPCQKWDADSQSFVVDEDYQTDLIGTEDVAKLLDMNIDRVRYLSRLGRLPSIVLSSKSRVFSRKQLLQLEKPY
tara:strand:- start:16144 stop:16491 length:348 start_codon:yes stop_codon:yes gene_type:complete